ncbi:MAG: hypothetical protein F4X64_08270 [Chloroflexi bacterium]|nr:hypothetical protein [Chloroflexota bacterium]
MRPQVELTAGLTATCCSTLQYLEGAAYIAIVLAVLGVPQLLTHYFDRRDRRRDRAEAERIRREEREAAERRHQEMMTALTGTITALTAVLERNGHSAPTDESPVIGELQRRVAELEAENARLRNGKRDNPPDSSASE